MAVLIMLYGSGNRKRFKYDQGFRDEVLVIYKRMKTMGQNMESVYAPRISL